MSEAIYRLRQQIDRLETVAAHPQDLWDLGTRLCHMAKVRAGRATGPAQRSRVPGLPVDREGPSQGEQGADALSTDVTRNSTAADL